jgi:hypothetical protein
MEPKSNTGDKMHESIELMANLNILNQCKKDIGMHRKKIDNLEDEIKEREKIIFNSCKHEWHYDETSGCCEKNRYICKTCKLYRNPYFYS